MDRHAAHDDHRHDDHHGHNRPSDEVDHEHSHTHDHDNGHDHDHDHEGHHHDGPGHDHGPRGLIGRVRHLIVPHTHDHSSTVDAELEGSQEGMRALWLSLALLGVTALLQGLVVVASGSVALLGDTLHNLADALTALPLGLAFLLGRLPATRRYTYGYGRAEDIAGIIIVAFIAASAVAAGWAAIDRLRHPADVRYLGVVAAAAVIGFLGNEAVAQLRIRVGRRIGSAALVADGLHARADGFTSLAVLLGAGGVALGWGWADPVIGLVITAAIVAVGAQALREVYRRLMDAVDPSLVDAAEATLRSTDGVVDVGSVRVRWIGHRLRAECEIVVEADLTVVQAHAIAVDAEHRLIHNVPRLTAAVVHADPRPHDGADHHAVIAHHRPRIDRGDGWADPPSAA